MLPPVLKNQVQGQAVSVSSKQQVRNTQGVQERYGTQFLLFLLA